MEWLTARLSAQANVRKVQGVPFSWDVELLEAIDASIQSLEMVGHGRRRFDLRRQPADVSDVVEETRLLQSFRELIESVHGPRQEPSVGEPGPPIFVDHPTGCLVNGAGSR